MPVKEILSLDDFNNILQKHNKVIVDFFAIWCGPCKQISPFFLEQSTKYPDVTFCKVDIEKNEEIANKYNIQSLPTFMTFKNGEMVNQSKGASTDNIIKLVKNLSS